MRCNPSKCKELIIRKKGHMDNYDSILNISQCNSLLILGLTFQPHCRFELHVKNKLCKANQCLYIVRSLRKEGCSQEEVDYLFKSLVLSNLTYALPVYGAIDADLATLQQFLDRCFKRRYISKPLSIKQLLEKQDKNIFKKVACQTNHPLYGICPVAKEIGYSLRGKSSLRPCIHTERFKNTYINRLIFRYNLVL